MKRPHSFFIILAALGAFLIFVSCSFPLIAKNFQGTAKNGALITASDARTVTPDPSQVAGQSSPTMAPLASSTPTKVTTPTITPTDINGATVLTPQGTAQGAQYLGEHTVKAGETLEMIARAYGVDPKAIATVNNLKDGQVTPGQVLKIPPVPWVNMTWGPVAELQFPPLTQNNVYFSK